VADYTLVCEYNKKEAIALQYFLSFNITPYYLQRKTNIEANKMHSFPSELVKNVKTIFYQRAFYI